MKFSIRLHNLMLRLLMLVLVVSLLIKFLLLPKYAPEISTLTFICLAYFFNRHAKKHEASEIGWANLITIFRGGCIAIMSGYLFANYTIYVSIVYIFIIVLDLVDGYVARKTNTCSHFGMMIDIECDAMGMLIAIILLLHYEILPTCYILVGLLRYLFVIHTYLWKKRNKQIYELPPSNYRRFIAGLHMIFIAIALLPYFSQELLHSVSYVFLIPFSVTFIRDWLCVLGKINLESNIYKKIHKANKVCFMFIFPIIASVILWANTWVYSILFLLLICKQHTNKSIISGLIIILHTTMIIFVTQEIFPIILSSIIVVSVGSNIRN